MQISRLDLGALGVRTARIFGQGSPGGLLLGNGEASGFSVDALSGHALVRWPASPSNQFSGDWNNKMQYTSPPTKWIRDPNGLYVSGTTLRCDHLADGTALGLLVEGQRTNSIRNNSMQGAAAGTPGTLPTNWFTSVGTSGLSREVVGTGTENGIDYIDLRFFGTVGASGQSVVVGFEGGSVIVAASGETWTASLFHKLQAGSLTGLATPVIVFAENTSGGSFVAGGTPSITAPTSSALGSQRQTATRTLSGGGTVARVQSSWSSSLSNGASVDFTLRIGWPQLELGAHASSPIRTTTAAVTRAADNISIALSSLPFDATKGTLLPKVIPGNIVSQSVIAQLRQDGSNLIQMYLNSAARSALGSSGGATQFSLSSGSAVVGTAYKSALSWKANDAAFSADGGTIQTDTSVSLPTPTTLYIGSANGSANTFNGWLQQLVYLPRDMSDSELVAWSTL